LRDRGYRSYVHNIGRASAAEVAGVVCDIIVRELRAEYESRGRRWCRPVGQP
jgi:hypothetical protein